VPAGKKYPWDSLQKNRQNQVQFKKRLGGEKSEIVEK
jgi:hypothetical protein